MRIVDLDRDPAPESSALDRITREAAFRLEALPLRYEEGRLVIALAEPPTRDVRREISRLSGRQPEFVLANTRLLADAIERWYPHPSIGECGSGHRRRHDRRPGVTEPDRSVVALPDRWPGRRRREARGVGVDPRQRSRRRLAARGCRRCRRDRGAPRGGAAGHSSAGECRRTDARHHRAPAPRRATSWSGACFGPAGSTSTPPDRRAAGSIPRCPVSDRELPCDDHARGRGPHHRLCRRTPGGRLTERQTLGSTRRKRSCLSARGPELAHTALGEFEDRSDLGEREAFVVREHEDETVVVGQ